MITKDEVDFLDTFEAIANDLSRDAFTNLRAFMAEEFVGKIAAEVERCASAVQGDSGPLPSHIARIETLVSQMKEAAKKIRGGIDMSAYTNHLRHLEVVERSLGNWGEDSAGRAVATLRDNLQRLISNDPDPGFDPLRATLIANNFVQALAPLATKREHVTWGGEPPAEGTRDEGHRTRSGYLLVFWSRRDERMQEGAEIWRLLRRELQTAQAIRLRPYKESSAADMNSQRVIVRTFAFKGPERPFKERLASGLGSEEGVSSLRMHVKPEEFIAPGPREKGTQHRLYYRNRPWPPGTPQAGGGDSRQAIGYFFIPKEIPAMPSEPGLDHAALLALLMRVLWGLCPMVPAENSGDDAEESDHEPGGDARATRPHLRPRRSSRAENQLDFRLLVTPATIAWLAGGRQDGDDGQGNNSWQLCDDAIALPLVPIVFSDATTENCVIVHPDLLRDGGPLAGWFRPTWRVPYTHHRDLDRDSPLWLATSPTFDGRPGWIERIDLSMTEVFAPEVYPSTLEFPDAGMPPARDRRRSARVAPARPIACWFEASDGVRHRAYMVDYNFSGCRLHIPSDQPETLVRELFRILSSPETSRPCLDMPAGMINPWPQVRQTAGRKIGLILSAAPGPGEADTRVRTTDRSMFSPPAVVELRLLLNFAVI